MNADTIPTSAGKVWASPLTCLTAMEMDNIYVGFAVDKNVLSLLFKFSVLLHTPYIFSHKSLCRDNNVDHYYYCDYYQEEIPLLCRSFKQDYLNLSKKI